MATTTIREATACVLDVRALDENAALPLWIAPRQAGVPLRAAVAALHGHVARAC